MITTRWIIHCEMCGYLLRPEYPARWTRDKYSAYRFDHKREALSVVAEYSSNIREWLIVEPFKTEVDAIFD